MKVLKVITHPNFHLDEAFAIFLLNRFGGLLYVAIEDARLRLVTDAQTLRGEDLAQEGTLCVGCGGGEFDEHGRPDASDTCAAELVARKLGLLDDNGDKTINRTIARMIGYVKHCDRTADVRRMELPSMLKKWHKRHPDNPQLVLDRVLDIIEDWYEDELEFQRCYDSLRPNKQYFTLMGTTESRCLAVFETEDSYVPVVARAKGVDVVIVKNSAGNVRIFTRGTKGEHQVPVVDLTETIMLLRKAEMLKRGIATKLSDEYLRGPEMLREVPFWYFLKNGQMLLNGSDQAAIAVDPTKVGLNDIIQAVKVGARSFSVPVTTPATAPATTIATVGEVAAAN